MDADRKRLTRSQTFTLKQRFNLTQENEGNEDGGTWTGVQRTVGAHLVGEQVAEFTVIFDSVTQWPNGGSVSAGLTPADDSVKKMDERNDTRNATGCQKEKNDEFKFGQRPSGSTRGDLLLANIHVAND